MTFGDVVVIWMLESTYGEALPTSTGIGRLVMLVQIGSPTYYILRQIFIIYRLFLLWSPLKSIV